MDTEDKVSQTPATRPSAVTGSRRFDVATVRQDHPIEVVVAASGVELTRRGHSFMGRCPFHDDSTASLSVGGVPDRFHCFGCGAGGDVIEYVQRFTGLSFTGAVQALESGTAFRGATPSTTRPVPRPARAAEPATSRQRTHAINALAWEFFTTPAGISEAETYLREARGIDIGELCASQGGEPIAGYAPAGWHELTRHLHRLGVSDTELLDLDLAQRARSGELIDTYRGRLIVPVLRDGGRIDGFIGRDTTGDPRAPKYRNPTRTPTFDKSTALFRPTHHRLDSGANVVVVEGVLDALAIAAAAARGGQLARFAPATTSGVTVSGVQARAVLALHPTPPIIALDGDAAGREGTDRWLTALCVEHGRTALLTRLPDGVDPAEWLQHHGVAGLRAFDRRGYADPATDSPSPQLPGRDLVRICCDRPGQPVGRLLDVLTPLATQLTEGAARDLVDQAELEMTGARTEELRALTWAHVDLLGHPDDKLPTPPSIELWRSVREGGDTKTRLSRRTLSLPELCIEALTQHQRSQNQAQDRAGDRWVDNDFVFSTPRGGRLDAANVRRALRTVAEKAGLDPTAWTPRELRHSFVSLMSDAGVPLEDIARLVGHRNTTVTELVYRKQLRPVMTEGAETMNRLFQGPQVAPKRLP